LPKSNNLIFGICNKIIESDEFKYLFDKLFMLSVLNFFSVEKSNNILILEYNKLLKYSDFLSNSSNEAHRTLSLQIITLLYNFYFNDEGYQIHLKSIFTKFGLFGAEDTFIKDGVNLPDSIDYERNLKRLVQRVNSGNDILTDSQYQIFGNINNSNTFSFSGPTSLGKSFLLKHTAINLLEHNNIIVFILPTKALLEEYQNDLRKLLLIENLTNVNVAKSVSSINKDCKNILLFTQERLNSLLFDPNHKLISIDVLIIDEAHKLSEFTPRSITLFKVIRQSIDRFNNLKIYFSSPVINNPEIFLNTFNIKCENNFLSIKESPVVQSLYIFDLQENIASSFNPRSKSFDQLKVDVNIKSDYGLISYLGNSSKSNLVYSSSKIDAITRSYGFLNYIRGENLNWPVDKDLDIEADIVKDLIHDDYNLAELLRHGIAFHHGGLPNFIRKRIEELYSNKKIRYVFCTSTLLEGVNLPTENIFIYPMKKSINKLSIKSKLSFWNLAGRAGRYKNELNGNIICLGSHNDWKVIDQLVEDDKKVNVENPLDETFSKHKKILNILNDVTKKPHTVIKDVTSIVLADVMKFKRDGITSTILESIPPTIREKVINEGWAYICRHGIKDVDYVAYSSNHRISTEQHRKAFIYAKDNKVKLKSLTRDDVSAYLTVLNDIYKIRNGSKSLNQLINITYSWLYGNPLRRIISDSIEYSTSIKDHNFNFVSFDKSNKEHINLKITEVIATIESEICFELEMYSAHYFQILSGLYGENNSGINLSPFLEYGTMDLKAIYLQDYGFSRAAALEIIRSYSKCIKYSENGNVASIDKNMLLSLAGKNSVVAKEILWM
jgi:hypothetical protein